MKDVDCKMLASSFFPTQAVLEVLVQKALQGQAGQTAQEAGEEEPQGCSQVRG